jgi:hypothetical protein
LWQGRNAGLTAPLGAFLRLLPSLPAFIRAAGAQSYFSTGAWFLHGQAVVDSLRPVFDGADETRRLYGRYVQQNPLKVGLLKGFTALVLIDRFGILSVLYQGSK